MYQPKMYLDKLLLCVVLFNSIHRCLPSGTASQIKASLFDCFVAQTWGYDVQGLRPDEWYLRFPLCNGNRQSPIDIYTEEARYNSTLQPFQFEGFGNVKGVKMKMKNIGHTVVVELGGRRLAVTGGQLPGVFYVEQFHFHWGAEINTGSEHKVNGIHYPIEMHLVMYSRKYKNVNSAMRFKNGLAVLAVLVSLGDNNSEFDRIIRRLRYIRQPGDSIVIPPFDIMTLFPATEHYYRYYGSLTTPPCYESVIWTIFKEPIHISKSQLLQLYAFGRSENRGNLLDNYRDPQPLNGRVVQTNYKARDQQFTSA